jgi:hypothetical protein
MKDKEASFTIGCQGLAVVRWREAAVVPSRHGTSEQVSSPALHVDLIISHGYFYKNYKK